MAGMLRRQRGHHHAGGDLVAVGDADQRVGAGGRLTMYSTSPAISSAGGQGVQHAVVPMAMPFIDGDGVELLGDAAGAGDLSSGDELAEVLEIGRGAERTG